MALICTGIATEVRVALPRIYHVFDDSDMLDTLKLLTLLTCVISDLTSALKPQRLVWISTSR